MAGCRSPPPTVCGRSADGSAAETGLVVTGAAQGRAALRRCFRLAGSHLPTPHRRRSAGRPWPAVDPHRPVLIADSAHGFAAETGLVVTGAAQGRAALRWCFRLAGSHLPTPHFWRSAGRPWPAPSPSPRFRRQIHLTWLRCGRGEQMLTTGGLWFRVWIRLLARLVMALRAIAGHRGTRTTSEFSARLRASAPPRLRASPRHTRPPCSVVSVRGLAALAVYLTRKDVCACINSGRKREVGRAR